jgi:cytochrome P450
VLLTNSLLSQDESQFKQSDKFIPERWLKNNNDPQCPKAKDAHPFSYLPFGFGSRMCIGRRFAELEIEVLISRLVREFKIEWHHEELKFKSITINMPDGAVKLRFIEF